LLGAIYNNMEKRGQVDKALGALPIFFLVLVIVALFVALNAGVFAFKKTSERVAVYTSTKMPVLFEEVNLNMDGKSQRMSVLEAFNVTRTNKDGRDKLLEEIKKMTPNGGCLAFLWQDPMDVIIYGNIVPNGFFSKNDGSVKYIENSYVDSSSRKNLYELYSEQGYLEEKTLNFAIENSTYRFVTYRGECPNA